MRPSEIVGAGPVFVTGGSGFVGGQLIRRLVADGVRVRALARSDEAAATLDALGAEPILGDLSDTGALVKGMLDTRLVVHAAAQLAGADEERMYTANVEGTRNVVSVGRRVDVPTIVHVSTAQVILGTDVPPIVDADEAHPYPLRPLGAYARTKGEAERVALNASSSRCRIVAVRPRLVWGAGDRTLLPGILHAARSGAWRWIDDGLYLTSTCHVQNVVEGILAAAYSGEAGRAYFLTDGPPMVFRDFVTAQAQTKGVERPDRSLPRPLARALATAAEFAWRATRRPGEPPLDRAKLAALGQTCTVNDSAARSELGYSPVITVGQGLRELADER